MVILLSLIPERAINNIDFNIEGFDKFVHFVMYFGLVFLWSTGLKRQNRSKKVRDKALYIAVIGGFILGLILEITQHFIIKSRYFDSVDLIANGFGCIFGLIFFKLVYKSSYN